MTIKNIGTSICKKTSLSSLSSLSSLLLITLKRNIGRKVEEEVEKKYCYKRSMVSHPLAEDPDWAWNILSANQRFDDVTHTLLPPETPIFPDRVRIVYVSDTHGWTERMWVPPGDAFIHGGDFTRHGHPNEVVRFNEFLGTLPHPIKLVIAGNHELCFDLPPGASPWVDELEEQGVTDARHLLTNCTYLENQSVILHGIRVYGAPWAPRFRQKGSFLAARGAELAGKWSLIPDDTDIVITHCPPLGRCDLTRRGHRAGCLDLLHTLQTRVKPKYHLFGHIHEGYGCSSDGQTTYINGAYCGSGYEAKNRPLMFDLDLPSTVADKCHTNLQTLPPSHQL